MQRVHEIELKFQTRIKLLMTDWAPVTKKGFSELKYGQRFCFALMIILMVAHDSMFIQNFMCLET